ncbi:MAG: hypothetical protein IPI77_23510 [Saprospiraceae bacterium]|nr:hypothetical protein [Saprospiraceae bacterium]
MIKRLAAFLFLSFFEFHRELPLRACSSIKDSNCSSTGRSGMGMSRLSSVSMVRDLFSSFVPTPQPYCVPDYPAENQPSPN